MSVSVLLVEDDVDICRLLKIYLGRSYDIAVAHTATEAEDLLARQPFNCVVLDVNLPDRPGWDLLASLSDQHPETCAIVTTGRSDSATIQRAKTLGAQKVLVKPVTPREIKTVLDETLR